MIFFWACILMPRLPDKKSTQYGIVVTKIVRHSHLSDERMSPEKSKPSRSRALTHCIRIKTIHRNYYLLAFLTKLKPCIL